MKIISYETNTIKNDDLTYAVICAKHKNKWVLVKHKARDTWEIPGGHREEGENINDTAKRELFEETGAVVFNIIPICDYSVTKDNEIGYGRLFFAEVHELGILPDSEIEQVEFFDELPENLTYPKIQPTLLKIVLEKN